MSDLTATGCGCGCSTGRTGGDNCSCNILLWVLILSCVCGNGDNGIFGGNMFGSGCGGCDNGCGCNLLWIIILIAFIG